MQVDNVRFHLFSEEEVEALSVCEISSSSLYDGSLPHDHSVLDARLGTTDRRLRCSTCLHSVAQCPGHTGHVRLHRACYHPLFMDVILKLLRSVCHCCSRLLLDTESGPSHTVKGKKWLQQVVLKCKTKTKCLHCESPQPKYQKRHFHISTTWDDGEDHPLFTADKAYQIFKHVSEDDRAFLGFEETHPKSLILRNVIIPSPAIRPSMMISESSSRHKGHDELTLKLQDIVKLNRQMKEAMEAGHDPTYLHEQLQGNLGQLMSRDSSLASQKRKNGGRITTIKSIKDQIESKFGIVRRHMMGKRANFSSRSVIGPDPTIDVDELHVPYTVAAKMTLPAQVCAFNRHALEARIRVGANQVGGANFVVCLDGTKIDLALLSAEKRQQIVLREGMVVHRTLQDDDYVLFNRQPSLHQESMMAHRVKVGDVHDSRTFRINLATCKSYNADFDGDEMNMHVPQSVHSQAEMRSLFHVKEHVVTPSTNRPIIACCQDTLIGAYLLTRRDKFFQRAEVFQMLMVCKYCTTTTLPMPAIVWPMPLWTGKQVLSMLFPPNMCLTKTVRGPYDRMSDHTVCIRRGELLHGRICKKTLGATELGIVHVLSQDFSFQTALDFISDVQRLVIESMRGSGFSIGLDDCMVDAATQDRMTILIDKHIASADPESEDSVFQQAQAALDGSGKMALDYAAKHNNAILDCVLSGAKGSNLNLTQIMACVGQQTMAGQRPEALPSFVPNENPVCAKGFVPNSYLLGLSARQCFQHMQGGRTGIIDTAIKTAGTGYLQRKLSKYMENVRVEHDGTVRDEGRLLSCTYGGDGFCAKYLETVHLHIVRMSEEEMCVAYPYVPARWRARLQQYVAALQSCRLALAEVLETDFRLPFNVERIIAMEGPGNTERWCTDADLDRFIEELDAEAFALRTHCVLSLFYPAHVSTKTLASLHRRLQRARINASEAVGLVAATSIGEPTTQLTLNSVEYHTDLVIRWHQGSSNACIGETIDALLARYDDRVQYPSPDTAYLPLADGVAEALTVDDDGRVSWKALEAVTRHPPNNPDGSHTLVKITTRSGRTVTATKAKSFLVVEGDKVVTKAGSDLKVGDQIPVLRALPDEDCREIDLAAYLDPKEFVFTTTMERAHATMMNTPKGHTWYQSFADRLPYSRSDSCRVAFERSAYLKIPGFVYTKMHNHRTTGISQIITLDRSFGFFVGAYLAEGCCTEHQTHIANNCPMYRDRAAEWPSSMGIQHHVTNEKDRIKNGGISISIMFHSTLLSTLLGKWCNQGSWNKRVPSFAYAAPKCFVVGLLDGYLSGDGTVHKNGSINASSRSKALIEGISLLLTRMDVPSTLGHDMVAGSLQHRLYITIHNAQRLHAQMTLSVPAKEQRLHDATTKTRPRKSPSTLNDVFIDPVVTIEEVVSEHPYVYDLTVADTRNMVTACGLTQRDTFHFAGCSQKSVMGVPRITELLDGSTNMKTPIATVYLTQNVPLPLAERVAKSLVHTALSELVTDSFLLETFEDPIDRLHDVVTPIAPSCPGYAFVLDKPRLQARRIHIKAVERAIVAFSPWIDAYASEITMDTWKVHVRLLAPDASEADMRTMATALLDTIVINGGSPKIRDASAREECVTTRGEDGVLVDRSMVRIETEGSDLPFLLSLPGIDPTRTISNNVMEVIDTLGIEIGLQVLLHEILNVLTFDGTYINRRHVELLCESMCFHGHLVPVNRHGLSKMDCPVLTHCSFEQTFDTLVNASLFNEGDSATRHVTGAIMFGNPVPLGTGTVELYAERTPAPRPSLPFIGLKRPREKKDQAKHWKFFAEPLREWQRSQAVLEAPVEEDEVDPWAEGPWAEGPLDNVWMQPIPWGQVPGMPSIEGFGNSTLPGAYMVPPTIVSPTICEEEPSAPVAIIPCPPPRTVKTMFEPLSPEVSNGRTDFTPLSPSMHRPASPAYVPSSPAHDPYDPNHPAHPASPAYVPSSPSYDPNHPDVAPYSPAHTASRAYVPSSPTYDPNQPPM